jgi:hypothetical protein
MNKEARLLFLSLAVVVSAALEACAHKPAYSEMDANRTSRNQNQNQNNEGQATASTPLAVEPPVAAEPAPGRPPAPALKSPSFMDQAKGDIKDLPSYPRAYRVNIQIGPIQGVNTILLTLKTTDPMDKITAFYERVIKDNKWTVIDKIIDPEFSEWSLKKGEDNSAKVQVKKDQQTRAMNILMIRGEKLEGPTK